MKTALETLHDQAAPAPSLPAPARSSRTRARRRAAVPSGDEAAGAGVARAQSGRGGRGGAARAGEPAAHPRPRARRLDRAVAAERGAGRPLRAADLAQALGVHRCRGRDARARHRREHGHFQRGQHRAAYAAVLPGFGPARPYRSECRRTDDVGWIGAAGARCPGYRAAPVLPLADPVPLPRRGLRHHEPDTDRAGGLRAAGRRRGVSRHVRDAGRAAACWDGLSIGATSWKGPTRS